MLPFLQLLSDGQEWKMRDVVESLALRFSLTDEERQEMLPSGQSKDFNNRVGWAKTHMKNAGLVDNPTRGKVRLSERGRQVLDQNPESIDMKFLRQFDGYRTFIGELKEDNPGGSSIDQVQNESQSTPLELFEASYSTLRAALAEDLQGRLIECSPQFFEHIVVKLLHAMGYGGQFGEGRNKLELTPGN
jgi:restriction system protein